MSTFDAPGATNITALQLRRQHAARELDALREACASKEKLVATLDAAIAQRGQNASALHGPLQPHDSKHTGSQGGLQRAPGVVLAVGGGRAAHLSASALSDDDGGPRAAIAHLTAPPVQKRHKDAKCQDVRPDALQVLTVMAQNRLLPKSAWGMCRSMHRKELHLLACNPKEMLPLLRTALRVTDSGPQSDVLTLVRVLSVEASVAQLPDSVGDLSGLTRLDLVECTRLTSLPSSIGRLTDLTTLELSGCEKLTALPDSIGQLSALTYLDLSYCAALTSPLDSIGSLAALTELVVCHGGVQTLPESIGNLTSLTNLDAQFCGNLERLPDSVGALSALTTLFFFFTSAGTKSSLACPTAWPIWPH
eukprot:TRINITY_DN5549_c0_g1_i3.p1 TRINITY_DN5549_c0_g1~~TRINITY_DN5549_c0_g1_i3.p1  ORF type:complete len:395 (-),score=49.49 TRINITY_DN5549_c0_g1_i3:547-1638(-)